ncbi:MAG: signal peptidase I [Bacilli bacterium]|nr:signal peptidase I [Bacilli bacterium]MBN2877987.1 signal peptidase I [Bacilli bacterium]
MEKEKNASTKPNKKQSSWIRFFFSVAIILGLGYVLFNYVPFIAKYDHYVIVTNSMEPVIMVGDVVIVDNSITPDELVKGQIIAFYADINDDGTNEVIVHYLYSINNDGGQRTFNTISEAGGDTQDPWTLTDDDIVGAYVLTIPNIGPFLMFAQSTGGKIILAVDVIIIYVLIEMFSSKKKDKEQKEIETSEIIETPKENNEEN